MVSTKLKLEKNEQAIVDRLNSQDLVLLCEVLCINDEEKCQLNLKIKNLNMLRNVIKRDSLYDTLVCIEDLFS